MKPDKRNNNNPNGGGNNNRRNAFGLVSIVLWALFLTLLFRGCMSSYENANTVTVPYNAFREWLVEDKIQTVLIESSQITFTLKEGVEVELPQSEQSDTGSQTQELMQSLIPTRQQDPSEPVQYVTIRPDSLTDDSLNDLLDEHLNYQDGESYYSQPVDSSLYLLNLFLAYVLPVLIMVGLFWVLFRGVGGKGGIGGMGNLGKSNAKVYVEKKTGVTFLDVAGQDEAKESLQEIIDILHNPQKYTEIGAKLPKGALLVGPPGTGKTLLAKAVAGEAGVPFFSISGSDFVEMFVGMGAARVRDLFKEAAKMAPCIIFIDEIDTIGKSRDNRMGGNDEREQTLNQLLAEMDGFDGRKGVVLLAATNRPETLDPALTRPGRFDRRVPVELPDLRGRVAILKVHARDVKIAEDVDYDAIARATAGASGAELANIVNEAALRAVRQGRGLVLQEDLEESVETVLAGAQRKNAVLSPLEKKIVAYHETGHALVAALQSHSAPVTKITIVPRTSGALGYTMQVDSGEHSLMSRAELLNKIATLTGGRAAEELIFGADEVTTGASNDIEQATKLARAMITRYGMTGEFDMVALEAVTNQYLGGDTSLACAAETASRIDALVVDTVKAAHQKAAGLLRDNQDKLHALAEYLLEKETITGEEFMALLNK